MSKRARKVQPAARALLSNYLTAILHKGGVDLIRAERVTHLNDDEMDRLAEEWRLFRKPGGGAHGQDEPPAD